MSYVLLPILLLKFYLVFRRLITSAAITRVFVVSVERVFLFLLVPMIGCGF